MNKYTTKFPVFRDPVELLVYYDEDLLNELYYLYGWQVETLRKFAEDVPPEEILRMVLLAANGSGKSQFILAPCAAWMAVAFEQSLAYVTSSSASQLDTQTERFLDRLAEKMILREKNNFGGKEIWKVVKRRKEFLPNNSYIDLFATDEARKAEGKHPLVIGGEFGIFVDEGKSITPEIYSAIDRCLGATRRFDVSSAGGCHGHLYDICTRPELGWWVKKIVWTDCPHIRESEFKQAVAKDGLHHPLTRSIFFSEFTSVEDKIVITRENITLCDSIFRGEVKLGLHAGLDLSAGGDETVLSVWDGNVQIGLEYCRHSNTSLGVAEIIRWCNRYGLTSSQVWVEYDGFNRGIVDSLAEKGWEFNKVLAGSQAIDKSHYGNRMTELWFNFRRYVEEQCVKLIPDDLIREQLCNRYYRRHQGTDKLVLERKEEARSKGHPSPDRADATVMAFATYPLIDDFINLHGSKFTSPVVRKKDPTITVNEREKYQLDALALLEHELTYGKGMFKRNTGEVPINSSISCINNGDDDNEFEEPQYEDMEVSMNDFES